MNARSKKTLLYTLGIVLVAVLVLAVVYAFYFGRALGNRVENIPVPEIQETELPQKKNIKKITVQRGNDVECIEITPDGAVRIFETCGGDLVAAYREQNTTAIAQLFNKLARTDFSLYSFPPDNDMLRVSVYTIIIQTDTGTETVYLYFDPSRPSQANDVVKLIDTVVNDKPTPTATATPVVTTSPTAPGNTGTPSPTLSQGASAPTTTPTPTGQVSQGDFLKDPFTCVYYDTDSRPHRVSNVVCSTEPLPN